MFLSKTKCSGLAVVADEHLSHLNPLNCPHYLTHPLSMNVYSTVDLLASRYSRQSLPKPYRVFFLQKGSLLCLL